MRIFLFLAIFYTAIVIYGGVLSAQNLPKEIDDPIVLQTSSWQTRGLEGVQAVSQTPENCVMSADYDNDVRISFKATGRRLTALRIESTGSEQDVGQFLGFVGFGVGKNSYALQSNLVDNRLDASLLTIPNIVKKLQDSTVFRLKLGTQNTYYALQAFDEAYNNLMVCMGIVPQKKLKVVNHEKGMPRAPLSKTTEKLEMPSVPVEEVENTDLNISKSDDKPLILSDSIINENAQDSLGEKDLKDEKSNVFKGNEVKPVLPEWRAFKGDSLSSVLRKWSKKQGIKTHIALDLDPVLSKDISSNGSFEMAVNSLLAETGQKSNTSALVKNAEGRVTHVAGNRSAVLGSQAKRHYHGTTISRLRALQGTDLRNVLRQWSAKNNVELVWNAPQTYMVRQSVKTTFSFEEAVSLLLNQYKGQSMRPVAQLNKDPETGVRTLIINSHAGNY
jgi:hypothetical protein